MRDEGEPLLTRLLHGLLVLLVSACGSPTRGGPDADAIHEQEPDDPMDADEEPGPFSPCDLPSAHVVEVASMRAGRYAPVAFALDDGRVLVSGGYDFTLGIQPSAEIFDPADSSLEEAGALGTARNFASWVRLESGEFLVTGGFHPSSGSLAIAEIWNGTFEYHASMGTPREAATAVLLGDGSVLVAGGLSAVGFVFHESVEIYEPSTASFEASGSMSMPRAFHAAALLGSGTVLVVGGDSGAGEVDSAEIFDPGSGTFSTSASRLARPAKALAATVLPDGRVLVTGGANSVHGTLDDAWLYDPGSDTFSPAARMNVRRMAHAAILMEDGRVLVAGGWSDTPVPSSSTGSMELYDPGSDSWTLLTVEMGSPRHDLVLVSLGECRVLVVGGQEVLPPAPAVAPTGLEVVTVPASG